MSWVATEAELKAIGELVEQGNNRFVFVAGSGFFYRTREGRTGPFARLALAQEDCALFTAGRSPVTVGLLQQVRDELGRLIHAPQKVERTLEVRTNAARSVC